jgi:hypothetical protein
MSEEKPTIHAALLAVMNDVTYVGKDQYNEQQKFNFRGIDGVLDAVGPAFRKHGILPMPEVTSVESTSYTTKNGTVMTRSVVRVNYDFRGPAGDTLTAIGIPGESADSGDKSVSKAMSVAYRTALVQVLALPTHQPDPDADTEEKEAAQQPDPDADTEEKEAAQPAVVTEDQSATELDWESATRMKEAHQAYVAMVKDEPEEVKAALRAYRKDKGFPWPMAVAQLDALLGRFMALKRNNNGAEDLVAAFPGAELLGDEKS